jgi:curved DNA-binding protein CbpA
MRVDDPYVVLGVDTAAAHDDIRRAWLAAARAHHPDRGGDSVRMQAVNEAWAVLGDPARRRAWDREHGRKPPTGDREAEAPEAADVDLDLDLLDPRPLVEPRRSPFDLAPVALFALAIVVGCLALALDVPAMLGLAVFLFFLSCLAVVAAAMLSMRRSVRAGRR